MSKVYENHRFICLHPCVGVYHRFDLCNWLYRRWNLRHLTLVFVLVHDIPIQKHPRHWLVRNVVPAIFNGFGLCRMHDINRIVFHELLLLHRHNVRAFPFDVEFNQTKCWALQHDQMQQAVLTTKSHRSTIKNHEAIISRDRISYKNIGVS